MMVENLFALGLNAPLIVLVGFISPFTSYREMVHSLFSVREFLEVFVNTPLDGSYKAPLTPEIHLSGTMASPGLILNLLTLRN